MRQPIFLFSAGWRSGSTLLQRMITASGESLIWGEPGGALNYMSDAWQGYSQMLGEGSQRFKFGYGGNGLAQYEEFCKSGRDGVNKWIASMNAPQQVFLDAYREFFDRVYGAPAREQGYEGWGVKEVQSGRETVDFLKLLYPEAKFVYLVRHPLSCLLSIKRRNWLDEADAAKALQRYSEHWTKLASEFRALDHGFLISYEKLLNEKGELERLADYLALSNLRLDFADNSRADWQAAHDEGLSYFEKRRILKIVGAEMAAHGYK